MAKKKGLPKRFAKMGFKRGWREYKKTLAKPISKRRKKPMAKRKYIRRAKQTIFTKSFRDGCISAGGKLVVRKVWGGSPIMEAGIDVLLGFGLKNKTLLGQGIVNGVTHFLPSLNLGGFGGRNGGVR